MPDDVRAMLDELERLEKAATPGDWVYRHLEIHPDIRSKDDNAPDAWNEVHRVNDDPYKSICGLASTRGAYELEEANGQFIAAARNALPTLLRLARRAGEMEAFAEVFDAAFGLCCGYDWNHGSHAIMHGYRRKLLEAVNRIRPIPDFSGKIANLKEQGHD